MAEHKKNSIFVFTLTLGALVAIGPLSIDMYLPALPTIAKDLATPLSSVQFSLTMYFLGLTIGQLFYGPISDRFGRKKPLYFGLVIYSVSSLGCALATGTESLILFRFLQALGGCGGMVISRAIVRDRYDGREAATVFSLLMLVMGAAPILAPVIGAYFTEFHGWRSIFYSLSILGMLSLLSTKLFVQETRGSRPDVQLSKAGSAYLGILKNPRFMGYALAGGSAQAGMFAYITGSPFVFIEYFGFTSGQYGIVFGANAFALILVSQLNIWILRVVTPERILEFSFRVLFLAGSGLLVSSLLEMTWIIQMAFLFVYIAILGITFPNTTAAALSTEAERAGSASALMGTVQFALATLVSGGLSYFQGSTSVAMAAGIFICAGGAFVLGEWMRFRMPSI